MDLDLLIDDARRLHRAVSGVVLGGGPTVRHVLCGLLAGGHVLLEGEPGIGKTLLGEALARAVGAESGRVQGTVDLLPSDLTGVSIFDPEQRTWEFHPGPLFHPVVIVDELNRVTPRAQSALLEAMAEGAVTVDGDRHPLPDPFFVVATRNPATDGGVFPLVGGQLDRFALSAVPEPLGRDDERRLLRDEGGRRALAEMPSLIDAPHLSAMVAACRGVFVSDAVLDVVQELVAGIRSGYGRLSTRAPLDLLATSRAHAVLDGREYVAPDDVQAMVGPVVRHRLGLDDVAVGGLRELVTIPSR